MSKPQLAIVVTTINKGDFLDVYCQQSDAEGWREHLRIIVIPDRKSPSELYEKCRSLTSAGFDLECPTVEEQAAFLRKVGDVHQIIPYNSDNRRNIGFLMALEKGCDFLISIDDDNFCRVGEPFFREHAIVCQGAVELEAVHSTNGWFNICDLMTVEPANVYPRGFPYHARSQSTKVEFIREQGNPHLNAGLWLGEPDLDAITWLANPASAKTLLRESVFLGQDTWSPINTQNTSLHRDAVVTYYFVRMGHHIGGMPIDRYGDIFSGYFCQACIRHLGYRIRVGTPAVEHIRNKHNYLHDLTNELACIWLIEDVTLWLRELQLEGRTYAEAYLSLAEALDDATERFSGFIWNDTTREYFHQIASCMRIWVRAVKVVGGA